MRMLAALCCALLATAATATATPKGKPADLAFIKDAKTAAEVARTRGKLILLTVVVDTDADSRMVPESVFRDAAFRRIAPRFVLLYANRDFDHGQVKRKTRGGKTVTRCADCPSIRCEDHVVLAQQYARGFYPTPETRTPIHFVLDHNEDVVEMIYLGDLESGLSHIPAAQLVGRLEKLLDKHGKGLSEGEYERMLGDLADARAARARGSVAQELRSLLRVVSLDAKSEAIVKARERVEAIDGQAARMLEDAESLATEKKWEEALDKLATIEKTYSGAPTAQAAQKRRKKLLKEAPVKKLLKARDLFRRALEYERQGKPERARKKFEECVRRGKGTPYEQRARDELARLATSGSR